MLKITRNTRGYFQAVLTHPCFCCWLLLLTWAKEYQTSHRAEKAPKIHKSSNQVIQGSFGGCCAYFASNAA
jgi:hypothetical protein